MKTVFRNAWEVAHIWAQQNQASGRTPTRHCYFDGKTIYSYGSHFPLATFVEHKGEKIVIRNTDRYSVTTSDHQGAVYKATSHFKRISCDTETIRFLVGYEGRALKGDKKEIFTKSTRKELACALSVKAQRALANAATSASKRRKPYLVQSDIASGLSAYSSAVELLAIYGLKISPSVRKMAEALQSDLGATLELHKKALAADARKKEKALKEKKAALEKAAVEAKAKWRAGEQLEYKELNALRCVAPILRIKGEAIETSHNVEFPLEHGVKAWPVLKAIIASGKPWHKNGHTIHLGHYQIDKVENGNIFAGCHTVPFSEVERIAKELNLV